MKEVKTKNELRHEAKVLRAELNLDQISKKVVHLVNAWSVYKEAKQVLIYSPFGTEVGLIGLEKDDKNF